MEAAAEVGMEEQEMMMDGQDEMPRVEILVKGEILATASDVDFQA